MIKTVIFDLGGVYFTDGTKSAIEIISSKFNVPKEKIRKILNGELGTQYRIDAITSDEFWVQAKKSLGLDVPSKELADIWLEGYKPINGTKEIIDRLNKAGYELLFLSDNVQERVDYLEERFPFLSKFKDGIFSHNAKTRKPDPNIYKYALEKSSSPPEQCVYIDDKPKLLEPAKELGMKTIAFENACQLEKELKELGLEF